MAGAAGWEVGPAAMGAGWERAEGGEEEDGEEEGQKSEVGGRKAEETEEGRGKAES